MPRRRYRLFTALAVVMLFMLYHVVQNTWDERSHPFTSDLRPPPENPVHPHAEHLKDSPANPDNLKGSDANSEQAPIKQQQPHDSVDYPGASDAGTAKSGGTSLSKDDGNAAAPRPDAQEQPSKAHNDQDAFVSPQKAEEAAADLAAAAAAASTPKANQAAADLAAAAAAAASTAKADSTDSQSASGKTNGGSTDYIVDSPKGQAEKPINAKNQPKKGKNTPGKETGEHWKPVPEHFPIPSGSLISLPTGKPKTIPKIQYDFGPETATAKAKRQERQSKVRAQIEKSWTGYKTHAWMHDELSPVSGRFRDPFCGWAATLVDSLDTLWIAGLKDEFDEAAKAVADIDFTYSEKSTIPVFETTIRYLGGLLSAFDVSGGHDGQYKILLDKAFELGEILMGIFDTPNRMPILYYYWQPKHASQPHKAGAAGMAELATLSMEFTRLAQLTKENKFYDAIDRITNALVEFQEAGYSAIPGLFPENLDASGCNRTATNLRDSAAAKSQDPSGEANKPAEGFIQKELPTEVKKPAPGLDVDAHLVRRDTEEPGQIQARAPPPHNAEFDCVPQGLVPGGRWQQPYHMGGAQDSAYEYFPKEYLLLGGLEPKYKKLYEDAADATDEWLMYRPMMKDQDWDVLFPAKILTSGDVDSNLDIEFEITHLTCFIGGMYGLGGKAFGREKDIETAKKLTDGCVWAYQLTATGIMPETAHVMPCPSLERCEFNETLWFAELDPSKEWHESQVAEWDLKYGKLAQTAMSAREPTSEQTTYGAATSAESQRNGLVKRSAAEKGSSSVVESKVGEPYTPDTVGPENLERKGVIGQDSAPPKGGKIPERPITHEEYAKSRIELSSLPQGFVSVQSKNYILRPEAIESVWYMYRITGDPTWMDKGWKMFESTIAATSTKLANSAIRNVFDKNSKQSDEMESFWIAETLKYYYLLFSEPDVISLDEWVLNTEAHPFRRPT